MPSATLKIPKDLTLDQAVSGIRSNPDAFVRGFLGNELWDVQVEILESVFRDRKVTVRSCHASGKSYVAAQIALTFLFAFPFESAVITTAPTWRQVEKVLWKEIRSAYKNARVPVGGSINATELTLDEKWFALGVSTNDPDRFNGIHAKHLLVIKDESSGIPQEIHDAIEGVASTGDVYILEPGNPTDPTGYFARTFKSPFYRKFHISCFHTPNFLPWRAVDSRGRVDVRESLNRFRDSTEEGRRKAVVNGHLIAPQWVFERLVEWGEESPMFQARCLGEFPTEGEDTLIALRHAEHMRVEHEVPEGSAETLGVDVARFGSDRTVLVHRVGSRVMDIRVYQRQDTTVTAGQVVEFMRDHPWTSVSIDDTGVGGGVTDQVRKLAAEAVGWEFHGAINAVNVGESSNVPEKYANLRAEYFWSLAVRIRDGEIVLGPDVPDKVADDLVDDLTSMRYAYTLRQQIQVESKKELRKRGVRSPDLADALMLAFAPVASGSLWEEPPEDAPRPVTAGLYRKDF